MSKFTIYRVYQTYAKFISANLALFPKPYKFPRKNLPFHPQNDIFRQGTRRHHHLILSHTTPPQPITHIVVCFLALYHNLNILKSRCKIAKLFLGAQYGFHRILTELLYSSNNETSSTSIIGVSLSRIAELQRRLSGKPLEYSAFNQALFQR